MRVGEVLDSYEVRLHGDEPTAIVAELYHVVRNPHGGGNWTPVGHLSAARKPAEPEAAAHWRAELVLRSNVASTLLDPRLPEALADWLLGETACEAPFLLSVSEAQSTSFVQRGKIWDDG